MLTLHQDHFTGSIEEQVRLIQNSTYLTLFVILGKLYITEEVYYSFVDRLDNTKLDKYVQPKLLKQTSDGVTVELKHSDSYYGEEEDYGQEENPFFTKIFEGRVIEECSPAAEDFLLLCIRNVNWAIKELTTAFSAGEVGFFE